VFFVFLIFCYGEKIMSNLYPACDAMVAADASRLMALGVFAMANGTKNVKVKLADGTIATMQVEKTRTIKESTLGDDQRYNGTEPTVSDDSEYDSLAVDGSIGSVERIAALAAFYRDNAESKSPCVLTDEETSERLISVIPSWASLPKTQLTPFQTFMIELAAEGCIDMVQLQKLIQEKLTS
jgi:hypothetical protein